VTLLEALREAGADKDENGTFMIFEEAVISGLDGDCVVPTGTMYSVKGEMKSLFALLNSKGGGLGITVIS
jgi:hypothetical protein